ncbi:DEAD-like helicase [Cordyceps fumosorosea ARSEF 2679]|uniref:RNA helicase n=1 Tax=Cordyceps fumosorosea (strain ARSEF 2679) TaxID=1081104 RepID=A0A168B5H9_CORFA|nr:DEAD-like helicase [Cordyceps fumosorosea ARSEF 2679]OAA69647.1 DEAD-like helicase [Cordyceps fumosorosea ARSEF 2679]
MGLPNKKRKQQSAAGPHAKRSKGGKQSIPRHRVEDAGSLAWQTFGEEFGGLEVIEGVDVIKEGDRVSFLVAADTPAGKAAVAKDQEDDGDDGEVFEGFGDDDDHVNTKDDETNTTEKAETIPEAKKKAEKKTKKTAPMNALDRKLEAHTTSQKKQKGGSAQTNSFEALMDADDDDDGLNLEAWVALNLSPAVVSAVGKLGFARPTAIQEQSIPQIAAGADVIGKAQTGSGKTLAFGIPIVERWLELRDNDEEDKEADGEEEEEKDEGRRRIPTAVILSPTRELAKQIGNHIMALCEGLPSAAPFVCVVTGGLSIQKQQRHLARADIVVGTPGRLWEVLDGDVRLQRAFSRVRFLVVDEADRLFKVGQFKEAELIIGALDRRNPEAADSDDEEDEEHEDGEGRPTRQTLVFSATFDKDLQTRLAGKKRPSAQGSTDEEKMAYLMKSLKFRGQPKFIDVNPVSQMAEGLREGLIECGAMEKDLYLYSVLLLNPGRRTLVFANSISAVRRLTPFLQNLNIAAQPLHSQMAQKARLRSLERFTAGGSPVLVATDVAARGLDIPSVDVVVHYHVPRAADTYVHRSGRTARGAHATGVSVLLCSPDEVLPTRRLAGKVHASRRGGGKREHVIETLPLDKKVAARLKPRADMAKALADAALAKERARGEDRWLRGAADDLGVEYDSDEFDAGGAGGFRGGRGGGRKRKEKEAAGLSKAETGALRAQLREDLARRVNLGVSERYIAGGRVDVARLIREKEQASVGGLFLGGDDSFGLGFGVRL